MVSENRLSEITKRVLLFGGAAVGGGLVVGYAYLRDRPGTASFESHGTQAAALNAWVKITPENDIIVAVPRSEMGQGVYTSVAMLICEELEVDFAKVSVEFPALDGKYINAFAVSDGMDVQGEFLPWLITRIVAKLKMIVTGGSSTIRGDHAVMPRMGAMARDMLIAEAADRWGVEPADCRAVKGEIVNRVDGRKFTYGELAVDAALRDPPDNPTLKLPDDYRLIGRPVPRLDIPDKVTGQAIFGVDVRLPDMLYAAVRHAPHVGGTMTSFDPESLAGMKGVVKIVPVDGGVAVIADNFWIASRAVEALAVQWDDGGNGALDTEAIRGSALARLNSESGVTIHKNLMALERLENGTDPLIEAQYEVPYLAHTCMEPMNCTVLVEGDRATAWAGTQSPTMIAWGVARGAGIDSDKVDFHMTYMGGGFGRRIEYDYVVQAAQAARAVEGRPVKLVWSREQDVTNDVYRPFAVAQMRARVGQAPVSNAVHAKIALQGVNFDFSRRTGLSFVSDGENDRAMEDGLKDWPYGNDGYHLEKIWLQHAVPVGNWRSVGNSHNAFFKESFVDEMAVAADMDPLQYRLELLSDQPRYRRLLEIAAEKADWSAPLGDRRGRGIAIHQSFDSCVAEIAEVTVSKAGELTVDRIVCVVNCGRTVNPDTVEAQMQSGIVYGLSAALYGEVTVANGMIQQRNFPDYEAIRLHDMPLIETYRVPDEDFVGGAGEPSTPPVAPAVTNAIFDATGIRIRRLPIKNHVLAV